MPKQYYAHSLEKRPREEWQDLEEHLKNVASLAGKAQKEMEGECQKLMY